MQTLLVSLCLLVLGTSWAASNVMERGVGVCECQTVWWVTVRSMADIPPNAVYVANDIYYGGNVYVGRAFYKNELVPGKVVHKRASVYIPYSGKEYELKNFEVLTSSGRTQWVPSASATQLPHGAVFGGYKSDNSDTYYVCRVNHKGNYIPGKLSTNRGTCYYPVYGKEDSSKTFEVLVVSR